MVTSVFPMDFKNSRIPSKLWTGVSARGDVAAADVVDFDQDGTVADGAGNLPLEHLEAPENVVNLVGAAREGNLAPVRAWVGAGAGGQRPVDEGQAIERQRRSARQGRGS